MIASPSKLTRRHEAAILALLTTPTVKAAARRAKVGEATMLRWLKDPVFRARFDAERSDLFRSAKTALLSAATECVATLTSIQRDARTMTGVRVNAAKAILGLCLRIEEQESILARLERLERSCVDQVIEGEIIA